MVAGKIVRVLFFIYMLSVVFLAGYTDSFIIRFSTATVLLLLLASIFLLLRYSAFSGDDDMAVKAGAYLELTLLFASLHFTFIFPLFSPMLRLALAIFFSYFIVEPVIFLLLGIAFRAGCMPLSEAITDALRLTSTLYLSLTHPFFIILRPASYALLPKCTR